MAGRLLDLWPASRARPVLGVRALNQYRRVDPFTYLGLRYHLESVPSAGDLWTTEVMARHFVHRRTDGYRRGAAFKGLQSNGEVEHRLLHLPSPAIALNEAYLLDALGRTRAFSGQPTHVYSYELARPGTRSGFFEPYHVRYRQRLADVREACQRHPEHEVLTLDIRRFYPSVPRREVAEQFLKHCREERLDGPALRVAETFLAHFDALSPEDARSIPTGPALSHVLANVAFSEVDRELLAAFPAGYFRYVDDLIVLCPRGGSQAAIQTVEAAVRPYVLNAEKAGTLTTNVWVDGCPWPSGRQVRPGSWEAFVAMLKMFATLHQKRVGELASALSAEGFNIPLDEFDFRARTPGFGTKLRQLWHGRWHVLRRVARGSTPLMVEEALRLRARFREQLDQQLSRPLPTDAVLRKWQLQKLKYVLGRALYLEPFQAYPRLEQASVGVPELRETWAVIHAVNTGDATEVIRASGHAPQALAGLLRAGAFRPTLTHGPLAWKEAEVQALSLLSLYDVALVPAVDGSAPVQTAEADNHPLQRIARGLPLVPDGQSNSGYYDELACLTEGRSKEERLRTLTSRFSADEEISFDALSLDQLSDDEPGMGEADLFPDPY